METTKTKEWYAAYGRYRTARNRSELLRARARAQLDSTGYSMSELLTLAKLTQWLREAEFRLVSAKSVADENEVADTLELVKDEINAEETAVNITDEMRDALTKLTSELIAAQTEFFKRRRHYPTDKGNSEQDNSE